jgi:hypothetical protein
MANDDNPRHPLPPAPGRLAIMVNDATGTLMLCESDVNGHDAITIESLDIFDRSALEAVVPTVCIEEWLN